MSLKKFVDYFTFKMEEKYDPSAVNKIFVINIFTLSASFFTALFSIVSIPKGMYGLSLLLFIANIAILFNFWYLRKTKNYNVSSYLTTILLMFLIGSLLLVAPFENGAYLWYFIFPPVAYYLTGFKFGSSTSAALLFLILLVFYFTPIQIHFQSFPEAFKVRFICIYIFICLITNFIYFRTYRLTKYFELLFLRNSNSTLTKTELILRLSHHVRTSLTNINLLLPMIKRAEFSSERNDYIDKINQSVSSMVVEIDKINKILIEKRTEETSKTYFSLEHLIYQFSHIYSDSEFKSLIRFQISLSKNLPIFVFGNQIMLNKILFNLTETFLIFNKKAPPEIIIRAFIKANLHDKIEILFEISTNSSILPLGSNEWTQDQLFDYFNIPPQHSDKGLGDFRCLYNLEITKFLLKEFNGNLGIKKVANQLVIWFTIFVQKFENKHNDYIISKTDKNVEAPFPYGTKKTSSLKNASVLIAEDNITNQQVLLLGLKSKVKEIEVVADGKEAIEKFNKKHFDIVLLDLQMPIMDGFKTVEKIRELEHGTTIHTPVIAITANVIKEISEQCFQAGFDAFFEKPYRLTELADKMDELLKRWSKELS